MNCARSRTGCGPIWLHRGGFESDLLRIPPRFWPHLCFGGEGLWFFVGIPSLCELLCVSVLQIVSDFLRYNYKIFFAVLYRPFKSGAHSRFLSTTNPAESAKSSDLSKIPPRFWPHLCYGGEGLWFFVGIPSICWLLCASVLQMVSDFLLKYCKYFFDMFYRPFKSGAHSRVRPDSNRNRIGIESDLGRTWPVFWFLKRGKGSVLHTMSEYPYF